MRTGLAVAARVATALGAVLLGALVGLLGAFQHVQTLTFGGVRLPVGVVLGIGALVLAQLIAREAVPRGLGPALVLLGWVVVVAVLGSSRPEGDLVVPAGLAGETFLYGGFVLGAVVAAWSAFASGGRAPAASGVPPARR